MSHSPLEATYGQQVSAPDPDRVARWMVEFVRREGELSLDDAVDVIAELFGAEFVSEDTRGRPAVDARVLDALRRAAGDEIGWDAGAAGWVLRS